MKILALADASVVVVQLPASAGGVPVALAKGVVRPFASGVMAPLAAYLASERDAASAVMARQADLLVHAGVPRPAVLAEAATARDGATVTSGSSTTVAVVSAPAGPLEPAGDVKRDGVKDVTQLGATVISTTGVPFPAPAGDLSGDHLDDLVITDPGTGVHARSGVDGHTCGTTRL